MFTVPPTAVVLFVLPAEQPVTASAEAARIAAATIDFLRSPITSTLLLDENDLPNRFCNSEDSPQFG
jgi:hypothetical protein